MEGAISAPLRFPVPHVEQPEGDYCRRAGFALGRGVELALWCDIVIASEDAKFGQPEVREGWLLHSVVPWLANAQQAKLFMLSGDQNLRTRGRANWPRRARCSHRRGCGGSGKTCDQA